MLYIAKVIATVLVAAVMQLGTESLVSTTPREAVTDFMESLRTRDTYALEKYMDDRYVNFIINVQGDEKAIERMNEALFSDFKYDVERIARRDDMAVAIVNVTSDDFSGVLDAYNKASYDYVVDNLYKDEIADKEWLAAQCLEIYVQQIEKAAEADETVEKTVYIPMVDDGYYGWNIVMTDELMISVLGDLQIPIASE